MKKLIFLTLLLTTVSKGYGWYNQEMCEPYCNPRAFCKGNFHVGAEWLFEKADQDNLLLGLLNTRIGSITNRETIGIHNPWESGYRIFAGYEFPCSPWALEAMYTHHHFAGRGEIVATDVTQSIFALVPVFGNITELSGTWSGHLNQLDIDVSNSLALCPCFLFRPHIGFRGAWSKEDFTISSFAPGTIPAFTFTELTQDFSGYGLEGGLWSYWKLGCGFTLIGHFGGSLLYSIFDENESVELVEPSIGIDNTTFTSNRIRSFVPTTEYLVTLEYEYRICRSLVKVRAGWQQQIFFNFNRILNAAPSVQNSGNLCISSVIVGGDITF